jgi:hypothetical protein
MQIEGSLLLLMLVLGISPMAFATDVNPDAILVRFNFNDGQWLAPRDEFFQSSVDLDTDLDKNEKQYEAVSSQEIGDEGTQLLYKRLKATTRIKAQ